MFDFYKLTVEHDKNYTECFFSPGKLKFTLGKGYASLFQESFEYFTVSYLDDHNNDFIKYLSKRFEEGGTFWSLCYSGDFGVYFLDQFIENLYKKFYNKDCILLEDTSNNVYELKDFYVAWKKRPFFGSNVNRVI